MSVLANGDFVMVWEDASAPGWRCERRRYQGPGVPCQRRQGRRRVPGQYDDQGTQDGASITALANGGFVVSWGDNSGQRRRRSNSSIKAQVFDADGTRAKVGAEFLVNTMTSSDQDQSSVASQGVKSGGFVVIWQDNSGLNDDGTRSGSIKAQMFDAAATRSAARLLVDTKGMNFANDVANVTGLANGGFVVAWEASANFGADTDNSSIQLQIFDKNGNKVGTERRVRHRDRGQYIGDRVPAGPGDDGTQQR